MKFEQPESLYENPDSLPEKKDQDTEAPQSTKKSLGKKMTMLSSIATLAAGLSGDSALPVKAEAMENKDSVEMTTPEIDKIREELKRSSSETFNTPGVGENYFRNYNLVSEHNNNASVHESERGNIARHSENLFLRGVNLTYNFSRDTGDTNSTIKTQQEYGLSVDGLAPGFEMVGVGQPSNFEAKGATKEKALENALEQAGRYYGIQVNTDEKVKDTATDNGTKASIDSSVKREVSSIFNTPIKNFKVESVKELDKGFAVTIKVQPGKVTGANEMSFKKVD